MAARPAGELLATHALRNALEADRVVADIEALKGLRRGLIRVCCSAGFAIEFLPKAMAQFRGQHPGMQFHLRVAAPAAVTQAVLNTEAQAKARLRKACAAADPACLTLEVEACEVIEAVTLLD